MMKHQGFENMMRSIRDGSMLPVRSREYWNEAERAELTELYLSGAGLSSIAVHLQRSEMAVIQQLLGMGLLTPPSSKYVKRPRRPRCLCERCEFRATCPRTGACAQEVQDAGTV